MGRETPQDDAGFRSFEEFLSHWSRRDFMKKMGAATAYTAFLAGGIGFLEACANAGSGNGTTTTGGTAKKGGHIIEGAISDIKTLNPVLSSDTASSEVTYLLYDGLYGNNAGGEPQPLLAKELPKTSADNLTYTVTLRDAKWTDGSAITADDVKFTYDLMFDPKYKDVNSPRRGDLETYVESITVKDPKTIVFKLKSVYAPFLISQLGYGILPKKVWGSLEPKAINTTDMNTKPTVTSGIFKFVNYTPGQTVELAKNTGYWDGAPNLDKYVYKVLSDSTALTNQLKTGEVDFGTISPDQLSAVQASPDVTVTTFAQAVFTFYAYNLDPSKAPFKMFGDKAVRQALLSAINRQSLADSIYFKQAVIADSSEPPVSWAYNKDTKPQYPFDKKKAEDQLDAAGWKKGSDGIRAKDGVKLKFEMITNAGNKPRENSLVAMQQFWKDIGVDATPKLIQFPALVQQITNGRTFDIFLVGFSFGADPDQSTLWHSRNSAPGGFNGAFYKSPTTDKLMDDAVATLDQKKRKEIYAKVQDAIAEDVPAPILIFTKAIWGANKRMQGYGGASGLGAFTQFNPRHWMKDAYVTDGK